MKDKKTTMRGKGGGQMHFDRGDLPEGSSASINRYKKDLALIDFKDWNGDDHKITPFPSHYVDRVSLRLPKGEKEKTYRVTFACQKDKELIDFDLPEGSTEVVPDVDRIASLAAGREKADVEGVFTHSEDFRFRRFDVPVAAAKLVEFWIGGDV